MRHPSPYHQIFGPSGRRLVPPHTSRLYVVGFRSYPFGCGFLFLVQVSKRVLHQRGDTSQQARHRRGRFQYANPRLRVGSPRPLFRVRLCHGRQVSVAFPMGVVSNVHLVSNYRGHAPTPSTHGVVGGFQGVTTAKVTSIIYPGPGTRGGKPPRFPNDLFRVFGYHRGIVFLVNERLLQGVGGIFRV